MTTQSGYLLGASTDERNRLIFQGEMFRSDTERLLDRCDIRPGCRAVDIGCGPLGIVDLLAERVGPGGEVTGLDHSAEMIEMARQSVAERGLGNVRLVQADGGASGLEAGSYDFVHTRLVLMNVPDAAGVLAEMVSLARPGGTVAVQDVDWLTRVCEPPHPAWDRLRTAIAELWRRNGMSVTIGRRLPGMLRAAGLADVGVDASIRVFGHGHPYHGLLVSRAELCRSALLDHGLIGAAEFAERVAELRAHLAEPSTIVLHPVLFQAWGTQPARS